MLERAVLYDSPPGGAHVLEVKEVQKIPQSEIKKPERPSSLLFFLGDLSSRLQRRPETSRGIPSAAYPVSVAGRRPFSGCGSRLPTHRTDDRTSNQRGDKQDGERGTCASSSQTRAKTFHPFLLN